MQAPSLTLRRTAYVLCGDWSLAEELTQVALVKVYAQWHRLRRDGADAYARRVLINASASRWRKLRHEQLVDSVPDSSAPVRSRDDHIVIAAALAELPPQSQPGPKRRRSRDLDHAGQCLDPSTGITAEMIALLALAPGGATGRTRSGTAR
jgi:hypothetical protein